MFVNQVCICGLSNPVGRFDTKQYLIAMEGRIITEKMESFTESFFVMFSFYFILKFEYAKE
ncbi:hypothetical protein RN001_008026, partial [Aquatica leii]